MNSNKFAPVRKFHPEQVYVLMRFICKLEINPSTSPAMGFGLRLALILVHI